jgi:hypothetical protein
MHVCLERRAAGACALSATLGFDRLNASRRRISMSGIDVRSAVCLAVVVGASAWFAA